MMWGVCVCVLCVHIHTYTVEYYSAIKENETGPLQKCGWDLESVMQSEVRKRKTN